MSCLCLEFLSETSSMSPELLLSLYNHVYCQWHRNFHKRARALLFVNHIQVVVHLSFSFTPSYFVHMALFASQQKTIAINAIIYCCRILVFILCFRSCELVTGNANSDGQRIELQIQGV